MRISMQRLRDRLLMMPFIGIGVWGISGRWNFNQRAWDRGALVRVCRQIFLFYRKDDGRD
jgi:hypothetical protein